MSDEMLLDSPEVDAEIAETELGDAPEEQVETGEIEKPVEQVDEKLTENVDPNAQGWKKFLPELTKLDPKAAGEIKGKLIALENIDKTLAPMGGLKSVQAFSAELKSLGQQGQEIPQILSDVKQERDYFRNIDKLFTDGSPEFASTLAKASPAAFDKAAVSVINEYAKSNPEGFNSMVAGVIYRDMQEQRVPLSFDKIQAFWDDIPDGSAKTKIGEAVEALFGAFNRVESFSKQQPRKIEDAKPEDKGPSVEDRETEALRSTWVAGSYQGAIDLFSGELSKVAGNRQPTPEQQKKILAKVSEEFDARLIANRKYGEDMQGFLKSKDQTGFNRRLESERKSMMPGAVRRAFDDVMGAAPKPGPKPGTVKKASPVAGNQLAEYPTGQIDWNRTTEGMYDRGEVYLKGKDGRHQLPKGK